MNYHAKCLLNYECFDVYITKIFQHTTELPFCCWHGAREMSRIKESGKNAITFIFFGFIGNFLVSFVSSNSDMNITVTGFFQLILIICQAL